MIIKFLIFSAFMSFVQSDTKSQDRLDYAVEHISKDLMKKAYAVIRKDDTFVTFYSKEKYSVQFSKVITILNSKASDLGDFRCFYKEGSEKVSNISIDYFDADGRHIKSVKPKELDDRLARDKSDFTTDYRVKTGESGISNYPFTIAMSWREESKSTFSFPSWTPLYSEKLTVESSNYKLENLSGIELRVLERNLEEYNIERNGEFSFSLREQRLNRTEQFSGPSSEQRPQVLISPISFVYEGYEGHYDDWESFGRWVFHDLLEERSNLDKETIRRDLDPVLSDETDPVKITEQLYDYFQENTRYIYIGLDEGGQVPLSTQKVHNVKYGDCKALSFYMKALLDAYDIKSNYVFVRANPDLPENLVVDYPHFYPANHIILNVPMAEDTLWLECTSNDKPFNFLGGFTDDRLVFQVDSEGGKLIRTPSYDKNLNKQKLDAKVSVDRSGNVDVDLKLEQFGIQINDGIILKDYDEKDMEKYLKTSLLKSFDNITIQDYNVALVEEEIKTIQSYEFEADTYIEKAGDYMIIPATFLSLSIPRLKKDSKRDNDILFPREKQSVSKVVYEIPVGYRMRLPEDVRLESEYGSYMQSVKEIGPQKIEVTRDFILNKGRYEPSKYDEVKMFFDKIIKAERTKYSMTNKS